MHEQMFSSIASKFYGAYLATGALPNACTVCGKELQPVDTGVDPYFETRMWITSCCGITDHYEQKLIFD